MSEPASLEELEKRLYQRQKPRPIREESPRPTPPPQPVRPPAPPPRGLSFRSQRRFGWWLMGIIALALLLVVFIFWRGFFAFSKSRVELEILNPEKIVAGDTVSWRVNVRNNNRSALEEGELTFQFPENSFDPESDRALRSETRTIGTLEPARSFETSFSAVVIGGEGFEREAIASLRFQPAGSSLTLQNQKKSTLVIERFPVELSLAGPKEVLSGERVSVNLKLTNEASRRFNNLRVRIEYPSGFSFEKSKEPLSDFNVVWSIGSILPREERTNEISGIVRGLEGEGKIFRALVEYREPAGWRLYKEMAHRADVARPPLNLAVRLLEEQNGAVSIGGPLTYELNWANNTDVPVTQLTLTVALEGALFDLNSLSASGEISPAGNIRWTQAQVPALGALRPGERGSVTFQLNTRKSFPSGARRPTLKLSARLTSASAPPGFPQPTIDVNQIHETKVNGELNLGVSASHSGGYSPPRVGSSSTFTIRWRLAALANDFKNVRVKAILPSGVGWAGGGVNYDEQTREVVWEQANIEANRTLEATFTVTVNPLPGTVGQTIALTSEGELTAEDIFTGNRILKIEPPVDTSLGTPGAGIVQ